MDFLMDLTLTAGAGSPVLAGALHDVWIVALRIVFFLSALLLVAIVLLQEGKGGGLAAAMGGQGADTFGVSSGSVNRVTLTLVGFFLLTGLLHAVAFRSGVIPTTTKKPAVTLPGGDGGAEDLEDEGTDGGGEPGKPGEPGGGGTPGGGEKSGGGEAPGGGDKSGGDAPVKDSGTEQPPKGE